MRFTFKQDGEETVEGEAMDDDDDDFLDDKDTLGIAN